MGVPTCALNECAHLQAKHPVQDSLRGVVGQRWTLPTAEGVHGRKMRRLPSYPGKWSERRATAQSRAVSTSAREGSRTPTPFGGGTGRRRPQDSAALGARRMSGQSSTALVHPVGVPTIPTSSPCVVAPVRLADGFHGAPIHARGFALAAVYRKTASQTTPDSDWVGHGYISNAWTHPGTLSVVTQLAQSTPKEAVALQVARASLGPSAVPEYVVSYPLCVRLSMTAGTDLRLELPQGPYRCPRLWPTRGADAHVGGARGSTPGRLWAARM